MAKPKLCVITTVSLSIKQFYPGQLHALQQAGFDLTVLCANDPELAAMLPKGVEYIPMPFGRTVQIGADINALYQLTKLLRQKKFSIVQYSTPKAALLGAIASFLARVPVRIYILWGLYYTGQHGIKRTLYKLFEKVICALSTQIVPISKEMVKFIEDERLTRGEKTFVIGHGSACGVDLERFNPDKWKSSRSEIRTKYNIPEGAVVVGCVARLTGDKGINELIEAFDIVSKQNPNTYLLLVGEQEEKDRLLSTTENTINRNNCIRVTGWQTNPLPFYAAMDIFCLPTYREGFGEVNLEAQAMELPVISTDVIGPRESVENGVTGILVKAQSTEALIEPLQRLINNKELRKSMAAAGRKRVEEMFDRKDVIEAVVEHRLKLVGELHQKEARLK